MKAARAEAAKARTYADYTRALRRYLNGFRDGHVAAGFVLASQRLSWPGFLVGRDADEKIRVLAADHDSNVPLGAELVACDGAATDQLMKQRLDPYYWNADIPHERWRSLPRLFQFESYETEGRMASCTFVIGAEAKTVDLRWRSASRETITRHWTVDWRVSPDNIAHLNNVVERNQRDSLTEAAQSWTKARDAVVEAMKQGRTLVRVAEPPTTSAASAPESLITGRVFLLTDGVCASACLDFTDVVRRLPNVTHVGLPTSADAVYIDNTEKLLPSSLAYLSYSLKVYRNRVRANNEWYEPQVRWPGGVMSDDAVTAWVAQLVSKH